MIEWHGEVVKHEVGNLTGNRLRLLAIMTMRYMQTHMTPRPPGAGSRRHVPSKPGQPPAVRSGNLRSSILWELDNGSNSRDGGGGNGATVARIGVPGHAIYGLYLEHGTKRVKSRPWMVPALKAILAKGL